jgi:hypothetical protein
VDIPPPAFRTLQYPPPQSPLTPAATKPSASPTRSFSLGSKPQLDMRVTPVPFPRSLWPPSSPYTSHPLPTTTRLSTSQPRPASLTQPSLGLALDPNASESELNIAPAPVSRPLHALASISRPTSSSKQAQTPISAPIPNPDTATEPESDVAPAPVSKSQPSSGSKRTQAPVADPNPDTATEPESDDAPTPAPKPRVAPTSKPRPTPASKSHTTSGTKKAQALTADTESDSGNTPVSKLRGVPNSAPARAPTRAPTSRSVFKKTALSPSESEPEDPLPRRTSHNAGVANHPSARKHPTVRTAGRMAGSSSHPLRPAADPRALAHAASADGPIPTDGPDFEGLLDLVLHFADEHDAARQGPNAASSSSNQARSSMTASSDLRLARLCTITQARTLQEKLRHARYPPLSQPPAAAAADDNDNVPQGEDVAAALDAAALGKKAVSAVALFPNQTNICYSLLQARLASGNTRIYDVLPLLQSSTCLPRRALRVSTRAQMHIRNGPEMAIAEHGRSSTRTGDTSLPLMTC